MLLEQKRAEENAPSFLIGTKKPKPATNARRRRGDKRWPDGDGAYEIACSARAACEAISSDSPMRQHKAARHVRHPRMPYECMPSPSCDTPRATHDAKHARPSPIFDRRGVFAPTHPASVCMPLRKRKTRPRPFFAVSGCACVHARRRSAPLMRLPYWGFFFFVLVRANAEMPTPPKSARIAGIDPERMDRSQVDKFNPRTAAPTPAIDSSCLSASAR